MIGQKKCWVLWHILQRFLSASVTLQCISQLSNIIIIFCSHYGEIVTLLRCKHIVHTDKKQKGKERRNSLRRNIRRCGGWKSIFRLETVLMMFSFTTGFRSIETRETEVSSQNHRSTWRLCTARIGNRFQFSTNLERKCQYSVSCRCNCTIRRKIEISFEHKCERDPGNDIVVSGNS